MRRGHGGRPRTWTDEGALDALRAEAARLGRTPKHHEMYRSTEAHPSSQLYSERFGSWRKALTRAGLALPPAPPRFDQRRAAQITAEKRKFWERSA